MLVKEAILLDTPVEQYELGGNTINVVREDKQGDGEILPPWGKMAQISKFISSDYFDDRPIVQLCVRGSVSGWVVAYLGQQHNKDVKIIYPKSKIYPQEMVDRFEVLGAEAIPIKPNMMRVNLAQAKKMCRENDWQIIPFGYNNNTYINECANRFKPHSGKYDTLIISAGSGVTCKGILSEFFKGGGKKAHIITTSSISTVTKELTSYGLLPDDRVAIHDTPFEFKDRMEDFEVPFDCNPNWDKKAWWWLTENTDLMGENTVFWNLGGDFGV